MSRVERIVGVFLRFFFRIFLTFFFFKQMAFVTEKDNTKQALVATKESVQSCTAL